MLRPKQLLPLYKGTRAWLVAGTSSGNKKNSFDSGSGPGSPHSDECNSESKSRNGSPGLHQTILRDVGRFVNAVETNEWPFNQETKLAVGGPFPSSQGVYAGVADGFSCLKAPTKNSRNASNQEISNGLPERSGRALSASENPHRIAISRDEVGEEGISVIDSLFNAGIAVISKLSEYSGLGGPIFMVHQGGPTRCPSSNKRKPKSGPTSWTCFTSSDKDEILGSSSLEKAGGTSESRRVDANTCDNTMSATKAQQHSANVQSHQLATGLEKVNGLSDRMNDLKVSSRACPSQIPKKRGGREISHKSSHSDNQDVTFDGAMSMQSDGSVGTEGGSVWHRSDLTGQRPANFTKQSCGVRQSRNTKCGGHSGWKDVVEQVCKILQQSKWGPDTEEALANLEIKLSAYHINEVLKKQVEVGLALNFFDWAKQQSGFKHDGHTYTTMVGILGRAKKFDALNVLLEDMCRDGCLPNVVTFNRLIHCYGRAHYLGEALRLFYHMQDVGCKPDKVTYCTLIDLHAKAGYLDVAMDMYRQMKQAGLQPDTFTYSVMINCLGKSGDLSAAHKLFGEMVEKGYTPNLVTYNIIIGLHAKAGKYRLASKLYNDMQDAGFCPDQVTYSIMMEVLGNLGRLQEAEHLFANMQQAGWTPDMPVYGILVDMWGKSGNVAKANEWYTRMLDSGLTPNVPTCNSLLGAFLRASLYDECMGVLQDMLQWGLIPTLQTYTLLLSCFTTSERQEDCDMLWNLMANTGHPAHSFLCGLPAIEHGGNQFRNYTASFFDHISCEDQESKRGFTDAVIDYFHKSNQKAEAGIVWEVATERNLYPHAVVQKAPRYWCINLHVMSMGTAVVAMSRTLAHFRKQMLRTGLVPERIDIITGWGRRSRVTGSSLLKQAVEGILNFVGSPFHLDNRNLGCFVGSGKPLMDWLHHPEVEQMHLL